MPLHRTIESVLDQGLDRLPGEGLPLPLLQVVAGAAAGDVLVLEIDLVVKEGHNEAGGGASRAALLALVASDGVVAVDSAVALLVDAGEDGVGVVREEALLVQDGGQALGAGLDRHGLAVAVAVDLADGVEALLEGLTVSGEADHREHQGRVRVVGRRAANLEHLGVEAGVDAVTRRHSRVAGHDGKVVARDGEGGAAVVGVSRGGLDDNDRKELFGAPKSGWMKKRLRVETMLPSTAWSVDSGGI